MYRGVTRFDTHYNLRWQSCYGILFFVTDTENCLYFFVFALADTINTEDGKLA